MVKRCVVQFCGNSCLSGHSVHLFPRDPSIRRQWVRFVQTKRPNFTNPSDTSQAVICEDHFEKECFSGGLMKELKFKSRKDLLPKAVPTIHVVKRSHTDVQHDGLECAKKPRKSRALAKLEVSKLLKDCASTSTSTYDSDPQPEESYEDTCEASSSTTQAQCSVGTQCSALGRAPHKSRGVMTDRRKMKDFSAQMGDGRIDMTFVETGTQCDPSVDNYPLHSTPRTGVMSFLSPFSSTTEPTPTTLYKPSDLSIAEAEEEESDMDQSSESVLLQPARTKPSPHDYQQEKKFLVFQSQLLELFATCPLCAGPSVGEVAQVVGTLVKVRQRCTSCPHERTWNSQPYLRQMPVGNLLLSSAMLVSGCLPSLTLRMLGLLNMACISRSTYHRHQSQYVIPAVMHKWQAEQASVIQEVQQLDGGLCLAGDGRSDSPGHSAKYGGYTLIEQRVNKVIDIQLVQSNEVSSSNACELEGLTRAVDLLTNTHHLNLAELVTDRHRQIQKWIREVLQQSPHATELKHFYDVWHIAKGLGKHIDGIGKKSDCEVVRLWRKSVVNHVYYVAAAAGGNEELVEAMWTSLANHVQDIHQHDSDIYPVCDHSYITEEDRDKEWLVPGTKACVLLTDKILSTSFIKDMRKVSPGFQTSNLEAFHSLLIRYAPKHTHFKWLCQLARYVLAALHYNENGQRGQATNREGDLIWAISFPKYKQGGYSVRQQKTATTYKFAREIIQQLLVDYETSPRVLRNSIQDLRDREPEPLAAQRDHPNKADAVAQHQGRYNL